MDLSYLNAEQRKEFDRQASAIKKILPGILQFIEKYQPEFLTEKGIFKLSDYDNVAHYSIANIGAVTGGDGETYQVSFRLMICAQPIKDSTITIGEKK